MRINIFASIFMINLTIILILICFTNSRIEGYGKHIDDKGMAILINSMTGNNFINANRKLLFFYLNPKKKKKRNADVLMGFLSDFLLSTGVKCEMYNWNNQHFVAVTFLDAIIDKDAILDRFKGQITDVGEKLAQDMASLMNGKVKEDM